jgi:hypothetical protein
MVIILDLGTLVGWAGQRTGVMVALMEMKHAIRHLKPSPNPPLLYLLYCSVD